MERIEGKKFDEERALYGSDGVRVSNCAFDGPADGESALKESKNIIAEKCFFNLRYPFWHNNNLTITDSEMTQNCRAALWYDENVTIEDSKLHGIKALRECSNISITDTDIISPEFGWFTHFVKMKDVSAESEYFMLRSDHLVFENVTLKGKYSFQYLEDSEFINCRFDTKDAFWHAKNVVVRDSIIKGEYLSWYSENLTLINCTIIGTQPLCYCKGLKLVNCRMEETDLCFEKSDVNAEVINHIISIKNPASGIIRVAGYDELIMDDKNAKGKIEII